MRITRDNYDEDYFENPLYKEGRHSPRNFRRLTELLNHKSRGSLLEIGCGKGYFLEIASWFFDDVKGVEISEYAGDIAKELVGDTSVKIENVARFNLDRES